MLQISIASPTFISRFLINLQASSFGAMSVCSSSLNPTYFGDTASIEINSSRQWNVNCKFMVECRVSRYSQAKYGISAKAGPTRRYGEAFLVKSYDAHSSSKTVPISESDKGLDDSGVGNGKLPPENGDSGGGGGGGGGEGDGEDEKEFGPLLKFEDVMRETEKHGVTLPGDLLEAAKTTGIRELLLMRYLDLQGSTWPLGFLMRHCSMLRDRMLADPAFLFKVGTEIVIDSCCATFAEVQKRGKDFWNEFELYAADLLVGIVVDIALVGMLAPYARIGQKTVSRGFMGRFQLATRDLPSSVFEAERPGCRFSVQQRIATYFYKGVLHGAVGFGCGIIGQGIANFVMTAKRSMNKSEEDDVPVPPLVKSAALWGVFLAVSSNTRYQIINGLERVVEASPVTKQFPSAAMAFTVGVRFANNIYGGMQFVDWAKLSGVQ